MLALPAPGGRGGRGGPQGSDERTPEVSRSDARLIGQAVKGRWPMSEQMRVEALTALRFVINHPDIFGSKSVIAATKALMAADKINIDEERRAKPEPKVEVTDDGRTKLDFSQLTDDEVEAFSGMTVEEAEAFIESRSGR